MKCPHCQHERSKILETRGARRRHLCCGCGNKFTSLGREHVFVDLKRVGSANSKYRKRAQ